MNYYKERIFNPVAEKKKILLRSVINPIKSSRLIWLRHMKRREEGKQPNKIGDIGGRRSRERKTNEDMIGRY